VRRAIASSDRWELATEFPNDFRVVRRPPWWLLSFSTVVRVQLRDAGNGRTLIELGTDSPSLIWGDVFQLYLQELSAMARAISRELAGSALSPASLPTSRRASGFEIVFLGTMLLGLAGFLLLRITDSMLWLLTFAPILALVVYASATKPVPPPYPRIPAATSPRAPGP
jgi:hypothetical protein